MNAIDTYDGILAAENNGFKLNEEICRKVLLDSLIGKNPQNGTAVGSFNSMMKREDEITDEDREWAREHICVTGDCGVDTAYLERLAKKCDEAKKKNPDVPYGGFTT